MWIDTFEAYHYIYKECLQPTHFTDMTDANVRYQRPCFQVYVFFCDILLKR